MQKGKVENRHISKEKSSEPVSSGVPSDSGISAFLLIFSPAFPEMVNLSFFFF